MTASAWLIAFLALAVWLGTAVRVEAKSGKARVNVHGWPAGLSVSGLPQDVAVTSDAVRKLAGLYLEVLRGSGYLFARLDSAVCRSRAQQRVLDLYFSPGSPVVLGGVSGKLPWVAVRSLSGLRSHVLDEE
ncbi:MAG TPA: hypothetical protein ENK07_09795, partial [Bacteroidetes bacterium]|nr:hypothetical protein [Bacteroidota bacterium]